MTTITVGAGEEYSTISAAVAAASSGDTIDVDAGTYTNDFPTISQNLTLQAVGGTVDMVATQDPPNGKAIIDEGGSGVNVTINGFDLSGAQVSDGNGAGIRYEGGSLTLNNDTVHNNQDGLLAAPDPNGTITVNSSTFTGNGAGDGSTHNVYVGDIASLTVQNSTIDAANVGHDIKSRAQNTTITNNTIEDGPNGNSSYEIDLPNGGNADIQGNDIEKGPNAQNPTAISFGEEGNAYANSSLTVQNNTMVNDDPAGDTNAVVNDTGSTASVTGNSLYGWNTVAVGPANVSGNTTLTTEPALSSLTPGGAVSSSADTASTATTSSDPSATTTGSTDTSTTPSTTATTTPTTTSSDPSATTTASAGASTTPSATAASTPAAASSDTGTTTAGSTDTASASSTTSSDGSAPISAATMGSSSASPTFIAGDTSSGGQQGGPGSTSTTGTSAADTSGTGSVASLAQASGAPLGFTGNSLGSSTAMGQTNGSSNGHHSHLQYGGSGAQSLFSSFGHDAAPGSLFHTSTSTT